MSEYHGIVCASLGEPLPEGRVGVRVRVPLSGSPSARWSRDLSARLATELVGHPAIGHLRLNDIRRLNDSMSPRSEATMRRDGQGDRWSDARAARPERIEAAVEGLYPRRCAYARRANRMSEHRRVLRLPPKRR